MKSRSIRKIRLLFGASIGILFLASFLATIGVSSAETTNVDLVGSRSDEEKVDAEVLEDLKTRPAVAAALEHPEELLVFITRPDTAFLERMAAAHWGGPDYPLSLLPELLAARQELGQGGAETGGFMVDLHPMNSAPRYGEAVVDEVFLFGYRFVPPATKIEYPMTVEEKSRAPWPWQVAQALERLESRLLPYLTGQGELSPELQERTQEWLDTVLALPCSEYYEAWQIATLARRVEKIFPFHYRALLRNMALNPRLESPGFVGLLMTTCIEGVHAGMPDLCQALALDFLSAEVPASTRSAMLDHLYALGSLSAPVARLAGQRIQEQAFTSPYSRAAAVRSFRAAFDQRRLQWPDSLAEAREHEAIWVEFLAWFDGQEPELERRAEQEMRRLDQSRSLLPQLSQCRHPF